MSSPAAGRKPAFGLPGRIQAPNSQPRSIAIVGLGDGGAAIARGISREGLAHLDVHVLAKSAAGGDDVSLAPVVSGIAHGRNHSVTALYIVAPEQMAADDATLKTLRSAAEMLVVVSDESYVGAMISALGS